MSIASFEDQKHPLTEYSLGFDYSNDLENGEELSSFVTTAIDLLDGSNVKSTILDGVPQIQNGVDVNGDITANAKVVQKVINGSVGSSYKITIVSTTTKPDDLPVELRLDIKYGVEE